MHVVVSGFVGAEDRCQIAMWETAGLSNVEVYLYKRLMDDQLLKRWTARCGIAFTEHLLLPNISAGGRRILQPLVSLLRQPAARGAYPAPRPHAQLARHVLGHHCTKPTVVSWFR